MMAAATENLEKAAVSHDFKKLSCQMTAFFFFFVHVDQFCYVFPHCLILSTGVICLVCIQTAVPHLTIPDLDVVMTCVV